MLPSQYFHNIIWVLSCFFGLHMDTPLIHVMIWHLNENIKILWHLIQIISTFYLDKNILFRVIWYITYQRLISGQYIVTKLSLVHTLESQAYTNMEIPTIKTYMNMKIPTIALYGSSYQTYLGPETCRIRLTTCHASTLENPYLW